MMGLGVDLGATWACQSVDPKVT